MLQSYLLLSRPSLLIFLLESQVGYSSVQLLGDVVGIPIDKVSMSFIMYNFAIGVAWQFFGKVK